MNKVSIVKTDDCYDSQKVYDATVKAIDLVGGIKSVIKPGFKVLIKPNLTAVMPERLSSTDTRYEICQAIADLCIEAGADPIIGDSAAAGEDTEKVIVSAGYDTLREKGYKVVDLKKEKPCTVPVENGLLLESLDTWELVRDVDAIIDVPIMKTHDQAEVTLGIKNMKGLIRDPLKKKFHQIGVQQGVVDINKTFTPVLTVMDATIAQEGCGPCFGDKVEMGLVLASTNVVSLDAVASKCMGYEPEEIRTTRLACQEAHLGEMDLNKIEVVGEPIEKVAKRFKRLSEFVIPGLPEYNLIINDMACTGCKTDVMSTMLNLVADGLGDTIAGKTIVVGPTDKLPDVDPSKLILVGRCLSKWKDVPGVWFVQGCPPNNIFIERALCGDPNFTRPGAIE